VSPVGSSLNIGKIWLGNESNKAAEQSVTGDVTISSAGVVSIGNGKINSDKILDGTIVNADISNTAGIVYSKLSISDGDLTIAKTNGLQSQLNSIATSTTTLQTNIDGKVSNQGCNDGSVNLVRLNAYSNR